MQQNRSLFVIKVKMDKTERHIAEVYNRYSRTLYNTAYRLLANSAEAEDTMQETIIQYYKSFSLQKILNPAKWLKTICIRKSLDALRRRRTEQKFADETEGTAQNEQLAANDEIIDTENRMYHNSLIQSIKEAIPSLPDGYRSILSLYLFEGYDYAEISQIMGIRESSVRSQYLRGKEKLLQAVREKMDERKIR